MTLDFPDDSADYEVQLGTGNGASFKFSNPSRSSTIPYVDFKALGQQGSMTFKGYLLVTPKIGNVPMSANYKLDNGSELADGGDVVIKCSDGMVVKIMDGYLANYPKLYGPVVYLSETVEVNHHVMKELKYLLYRGHLKTELDDEVLCKLLELEKQKPDAFIKSEIERTLFGDQTAGTLPLLQAHNIASRYGLTNLRVKFAGIFMR